MVLPGFISKIFGGGAKDIISSVGDVIDNLTLSKEEKEALRIKLIEATNSHVEKMAALTQSETEAYLKDTQDAREANARIQESDKSSWLAKNVAYILDLFLGLVWGTMTIYILARVLNLIKTENVDLTGVYGLYSTVTAVFMTVLNFHRGTSRGSEKKTETIDKMMSK